METLLTPITFGYGRVSTSKQGLSREAQTETVQRAAAFYGGPDAVSAVSSEMFFDDDTSGSIPFAERPAGGQLLDRVRQALANGESPTIIVTKVDRLGRDTVDVSQTVTLFETLGARVVFLDINVDTRTAMGRAFMQIAAVFAEWVGSTSGLGVLILDYGNQAATADVFAAVVVLAVIGVALFAAVGIAERLAVPWWQAQE